MNAAANDRMAQTHAQQALQSRVCAVSSAPLDEPAKILIEALQEKYDGCGVLFYGSGASIAKLDDPTSVIFDFYVIGASYEALYPSSPVLALANKIVPPNVFYFETPSRFGVLRAKYALLSIDHFEKLVSEATFHSYFWGRFAQPCRAHAADEALKSRLNAALVTAIVTFCKRTVGLQDNRFTPRELWLSGLGASYKAELRAEDNARAGKLIDSYGDWADTVTAPALTLAGAEISVEGDIITLQASPSSSARTAWRLRAIFGAGLSALRLLKGAQTFRGGIDYIAWKIQRHTGIDLAITDWERKHPMLGAPGAAIRYYRLRAAAQKGA